MTQKISTLLGLLTLLALTVVAFALTTEYFDAMEYISSAKRMFGDSPFWNPKNPLITSLYAALYGIHKLFGAHPSMTFMHVFMFCVHVVGLWMLADWLKPSIKDLTIVGTMGIASWSVSFLHYASFLLPDLLCATAVVLYYWVEWRVPIEKKRGIALRVLALWLVAFGRLHTMLIPCVGILLLIARTRDVRRYGIVCAATGVLYVVTFGLFHGAGTGVGLFAGLKAGYDYNAAYFGEAAVIEGQPQHIWLEYLALSLTPMGVVMMLLGIWEFWSDRKRPEYKRLAPLLLGSLAFFVFLLATVRHKEVRYLTQLLPGWATLQVLAVMMLARKRPWMGAVSVALMFASALPHLVHFKDPIYTMDIERKTSERIAEWTIGNVAGFLMPMHAIFPKENYLHYNDTVFYYYHWSPHSLMFYTQLNSAFTRVHPVFGQVGYPIPDNITEIAPPGMTMIVVEEQAATTHFAKPAIDPIYAIRWWPKDKARPEAQCIPQVKNICIEQMTALEGYKW